MATAETDLKATLAELKELAKDPEKRKEMADFGKLESVLEELMPWEDSIKPGYDKATLFAADGCGGWLTTFSYCVQMMFAGDNSGPWGDRAGACVREYEACTGG
jgi:hypothetical protein